MAAAIPELHWIESSPGGIRMQENPDVWHAGRVLDVLALGNDELLIGTESGGCWFSEADDTAWPLSDDWEFPNVLCLAARSRF
jgi:hypothetical protein